MPLIRMRDANLPWHASGEVEGKREEFCSPFLSDTQTGRAVQSLPFVIYISSESHACRAL